MNRLKLNNSGVSLVELLAVITLVSLIAGLAFTILFQGISNYERIKVESELRDEADIIMARFIKELFVLQSDEVINTIGVSDTCSKGLPPRSYIEIKKHNSTSSTPVSIGFKKLNASSDQAFVNGETLNFNNKNINLVPNDCSGTVYNSISSVNNIKYTVTFTLTTKYRGQTRQMRFENDIMLIDATRGGS